MAEGQNLVDYLGKYILKLLAIDKSAFTKEIKRMYLESEKLLARIQEISKEAEIKSNHMLSYEEYIALPYYGQIILRFMLHEDTVTLDDLDRYENLLNSIVGDEFLTDFMGTVYKKSGLDYSKMNQRMIEMATQFQNEAVTDSIHAEGIRADAVSLLKLVNLDINSPVWEIQVEDKEYILLLLGKERKEILTIDEPISLSVVEVDSRTCSGLIKAAFFCKRNHISLGRALL